MTQNATPNQINAALQLPLRAWRSLRFRIDRQIEWSRLPDQMVQIHWQEFLMSIGNPRKTAIARSIFLTGQWEPDVTRFVQSYVSSGMTVLDVGAYFGFFTLQFAKLTYPRGKVYAFELDPDILPLLYGNLAMNSIGNVEIAEFGLLDRSESLSFVGQGRLDLNNSHRINGAVRVVSFDEWRLNKSIAKVDFIKMDIEGAELNALCGMQQTLLQDSPHLLIEVHPQFIDSFGHRVSELYDFLRSMGYEVFRLDGTRIEGVIDAEHIVCRKDRP